jgi:signal transduction histidine kinase/CheY-like chemotaxis protein
MGSRLKGGILGTIALGLGLVHPSVAFASWTDPGAGEPVLETHPSAEFGAFNRTVSVVIDQRGVLYLGGERIWEYDGHSWSAINAGGDEPSGLHLKLDPSGRIWAAGTNAFGYLDLDSTGVRRYVSIKPALPEDIGHGIWGIEFVHGKVLVIASQDVVIWDGAHMTTHHLPNPGRVSAFHLGDKLIFDQPGVGWCTYDGEMWSSVEIPNELKTTTTTFALSRQGGSFLLSTANGMAVLNAGHLSWLHTAVDQIPNRLTAERLPSGEICILTYAGLHIVNDDAKLLRTIDFKSGNIGGRLHSLCVDPRGQIWTASFENLSRFDGNLRVSNFYKPDVFHGSTLRDICCLSTGEVFAMTDEALLSLKPGDQPRASPSWQRVGDASLVPLNTAATARGSLLIGAVRKLFEYKNEQLVQILESRSNLSVTPNFKERTRFYLAELQEMSSIEPTSDGWKRGNWTWSLPADIRSSWMEDAEGNLWVSLRNGQVFRRRESGEIKSFQPGKDLPADFKRPRLFALSEGVYLTSGGHALIFRADTLQPSKALAGFEVRGRQEPAGRDCWLILARTSSAAKENMLARLTLNPDGGEQLAVFEAPELQDLGPTPFILRREPDRDRVWVGGGTGLFRFDTTALTPVRPPPRPLILRATWRTEKFTQPLPLNESARVDFDSTGSLTLVVRDPEHVLNGFPTIESQLDGIETLWVRSKNDRTFSGLREGHYRARFKLLNALGEAGPEVFYDFKVMPPWFRSPAAYAAYFVTAGALVILFVRLKLRRSARRQAELEQLVESRTQQLSQAIAVKSSFLSNMGHEIRNPMNGVFGMVESLKHTELSERQRNLVETLSHCASYLSSVVEDVLDYAQIEAGKISLHVRPCNVGELVTSALKLFSNRSPEIVTVAQPEILALNFSGDSDRVRQILVNYLANAFKFAPGATITLNVERRADGDLQFSVRDQGPGIPPDEIDGLFQRFSRGLMARRQNIPGTGLGLASCKAYAEAMGGSVWAESNPGCGACFYLRLPVVQTGANAEHSVTSPPNLFESRSALVVDDQEFNRTAFSDLLRRFGCDVDTAESFQAAQTLVLHNSYDFLFLDLDLPDQTGDTLAEWIRSRISPDSLPLIFAVSAFEPEEVRLRSQRAGMSGFINKPITPEKLRAVLAPFAKRLTPIASKVHPSANYLSLLSQKDPAAAQRIRLEIPAELRRELGSLQSARLQNDGTRAAHHAHRLISIALLRADQPLLSLTQDLRSAVQGNHTDKIETLIRALTAEIEALEQSQEPTVGPESLHTP